MRRSGFELSQVLNWDLSYPAVVEESSPPDVATAMVVLWDMGKIIKLRSSSVEYSVRIARRPLTSESAFPGDGCEIAGAVQDANYDNLIGLGKIIDCVLPVEDHAQFRSEMKTRGAGMGKRPSLTKAGLDLKKKIRGEGFRCFLGKVAPDLC